MHGIMFHHFHDEKNYIQTQGSISAEDLRHLIEFYQSRGYQIIKAEEYYQARLNGKLQKNQVCITFDDGLKCQIEIGAEVLKEYGLTAFFFVPTLRFTGEIESLEIFREFRFLKFKDLEEFYERFFQNFQNFDEKRAKKLKEIDFNGYLSEFSFYTWADRKFRYIRNLLLSEVEYHQIIYAMMKDKAYDYKQRVESLYMNRADLKKLAEQGHIIGLHSHSHYTNLAGTDGFRQRMEYTDNQQILEEILQNKVVTASYPCNSYNQETLQIMRDLGIQLAFRANMEKGYDSHLEVLREDHSNIIRRMQNENYSFYQ